MRGAILAFVLGVWLLQQQATLPPAAWSLVLLPAGALQYAVFRHPRLRRMAFLLCALLAGLFYAAAMAHGRLADRLPPEWEGRDIRLTGVVASLPQQEDRGERFLLDVEQVETPGAHVPHHISIARYFADFRQGMPVQPKGEFHPGERWRLTVRLKQPHGTYNPHGFDFEAWALERNIRATGYIRKDPANARLSGFVMRPTYWVERVRESVREHFQAVLGSAPYAGVLRALAIGDESAIADSDWEVFRRTGVVHLVSISGLHVTMVAGLAFTLVAAGWRRIEKLALWYPARKAAALAALLVAGAYALLAGFAVPTQRTFYMLAVLAAALWSGRAAPMSLVLCWALLAVVVVDPWAVLAPGFWLSFGAVALLLYAGGNRLARPGWLHEALHAQWVMLLGLTPLLLVLFQQVSIVSPLANAFAIPVVSLVVTPLALLAAIIPLDGVLQLAHGVMAGCMWLLKVCADMPLAVWQQHAPAGWAMLAGLVGVAWVLLPRGFPLRWLGGIALLPMFLLLPVRPQPGELRVAVLDVGQGLAVVLQTAQHVLLYDAGPRYSVDADSGNRIIVPYLRGSGLGHLDGMVVSHDDADHSGGALSVIRAMPVAWLASSLPHRNPVVSAMKSHVECVAGQSWQWDGVRFDMLHPSPQSYAMAKLKDNERSCVLKVTTAVGSVLLAGDIERASEAALLGRDGVTVKADILVVPHHGSKTSSTPEFVAAVRPAAAVFTVGYRNRFGHPKQEVVERYRAQGSHIYRSDSDGAIFFDLIPGRRIQRKTWRQETPHYWHLDGFGVAENGAAG